MSNMEEDDKRAQKCIGEYFALCSLDSTENFNFQLHQRNSAISFAEIINTNDGPDTH